MFLINRASLEQRRKLCRPAVEGLLAIPREQLLVCNVCESSRNIVMSDRDRYNLPIRTAMCLDCGLVYLVDRFTVSGYGAFYESGSYRNISSLFNRSRHSIAQIQADQRNYAAQLVALITGYMTSRPGAKLLDIGGSAGVVAARVARHFQLEPTVLDPAATEAQAARELGVRAVTGSLEDWETPEQFDLILLCRSIEHLMDLKGSLRKIRELLAPQGLFYCDLAEFMEMCRLVGPPQTFTKIDHCYWLTQEAAEQIFRRMGFEIVSMNLAQAYVGLLLRKSEPMARSAAAWVPTQIRQIQAIEAGWLEQDRQAPSLTEWARRRAYRVKRQIIRWVRPESLETSDEPVPTPIVQASAPRP
jgi:ubiquinone/menaquinone biosynthesis C-methylase UbiE